MFSLHNKYPWFDDYKTDLELAKLTVLLHSKGPIWNSLKYYDDNNEDDWVENWMTERFYPKSSAVQIITDILDCSCYDYKQFKFMFSIAKDKLGLDTKQFIQAIDAYNKQFLEIGYTVRACALKEVYELNAEEETIEKLFYSLYGESRVKWDRIWERVCEVYKMYDVKRQNVLKRYTTIEEERLKNINSFDEILFELGNGSIPVENDVRNFSTEDADIHKIFTNSVFDKYEKDQYADEQWKHFFTCLIDNIIEDGRIRYNNQTLKMALSDFGENEGCWILMQIIMIVEHLSDKEIIRLFNLFCAMKESFASEDEEIPDDWCFDGKYDSDEAKYREKLVKQRDKVRLRKLLQKVHDEHD